jgi:DNA helicase-2/ATP-dependent DNA helicase PcrA
MKYYVTQQSRMGDRHVYGAKSRFLTPAVMRCLQEVTYGSSSHQDNTITGKPRVDVAAALRGMWT